MAKSSEICCDWRGDVTSRVVTASAGGPWRAVRGAWIGLRDYSGACRGFQSCVLLSAVNCGGRAENARALYKDKGREHPSLELSGVRAKNAGVLDGSGGRERTEVKSREYPYSFGEKRLG